MVKLPAGTTIISGHYWQCPAHSTGKLWRFSSEATLLWALCILWLRLIRNDCHCAVPCPTEERASKEVRAATPLRATRLWGGPQAPKDVTIEKAIVARASVCLLTELALRPHWVRHWHFLAADGAAGRDEVERGHTSGCSGITLIGQLTGAAGLSRFRPSPG